MLRLIKIVVLFALIFGGIFTWDYSKFESTILTSEAKEIQISGGGFQTALIDAGANSIYTRLYLSNNLPDYQLQKGRYIIPEGANVKTYLNSLKTPINESDKNITFLEGWNIYDYDKTLSEVSFIQVEEFSNFVTNCEQFCSLKADYPFISDASTLEGFLYPDTYAINQNNFSIESLVRKMLDRFNEKVINSGIITDMGSIEILDTISMASIVQKEANKRDNPEEIAIIAGILKKRLDEGWMIGADATICYPFKIPTQDCGPEEVLKYLYEKNEYNTRQMVGLPLTSIANPQAEVIEATINSIDSPYYYYLHDNTGKIHYGRTDAEHIQNKNTYLR